MNAPTQVPRDEFLERVEEFSAELAKPIEFDPPAFDDIGGNGEVR